MAATPRQQPEPPRGANGTAAATDHFRLGDLDGSAADRVSFARQADVIVVAREPLPLNADRHRHGVQEVETRRTLWFC